MRPHARSACLALLTGIACTPLKMAVPTNRAKAADTIQVTDRSRMTGALANESFKVLPYEISNVDRKWNSRQNGAVRVWSSAETRTGYSFTFEVQRAGPGPSTAWAARTPQTELAPAAAPAIPEQNSD